MEDGKEEEGRSKSELVKAQHGKQGARLELSKQHGGIYCMLGLTEGFRAKQGKGS